MVKGSHLLQPAFNPRQSESASVLFVVMTFRIRGTDTNPTLNHGRIHHKASLLRQPEPLIELLLFKIITETRENTFSLGGLGFHKSCKVERKRSAGFIDVFFLFLLFDDFNCFKNGFCSGLQMFFLRTV
jgi:hypothetical protein